MLRLGEHLAGKADALSSNATAILDEDPLCLDFGCVAPSPGRLRQMLRWARMPCFDAVVEAESGSGIAELRWRASRPTQP